jgi:hypothetical protein
MMTLILLLAIGMGWGIYANTKGYSLFTTCVVAFLIGFIGTEIFKQLGMM